MSEAQGAATLESPDARDGPAVRTEKLRKVFGALVAVDALDLTIHRGEVFGLLGPNGAGKTTTVEIVEGYRRADGGRIRVLGEDPARGGRTLRARVGLMLQDSTGFMLSATASWRASRCSPSMCVARSLP